MSRWLCKALALVLVGLGLVNVGAAQDDVEPIHVIDGVLHRGDSPFQIRAITVPDALAKGAALPEMAPRLARVAEVGGNALCFELSGFSEDGRALATAAVETVVAYAARAKEQRMASVLRVLARVTTPEARAAAVRTAAKAFKNEPRVLYLIDGPDSAEFAKRFKRAAPNCAVASEGNGDVYLMPGGWPNNPTPGAAYISQGVIPPEMNDGAHFVLGGTAEDFAAVEATMTTDAERNFVAIDPIVLDNRERLEGFVPLFNGRDLSGWWTYGDNPEGFHVSDCGEIEWVQEGASSLISAKRYANFTLRLEYKLLPGYNSGIYLRAPRAARQSKIGMEFQLHGDHGAQPNDDCTGAIYKVVPPLYVASKPGAEWNALEITLNGSHMRAVLNNLVVQDLDMNAHEELRYRLQRGFIGLQDHQNYVAFRNIRIKELP